ncbi:hypothetical protein HBI63_135830 [Parastagonospora nodorum]|nr:hypothetical protein HBH51_230160 [Parastagonospora nodorum]KAH6027083.1 hypothetical protein HBI54_237060 [Parastagonospora nodorum]KAH6045249.1 hypothetical protein HBI67_241190 [Parastagonospora nodorum]KAH6051375.1 hypothetical protein HBI66_239890 [Parastagonospora nodorum]KAH6149748.1 hypothetical protein HBI63_135830 [Parastagonospora nodorum]
MSFLLEKLCIDSHIEHKRAVNDEVEEEDLLIGFVVPEQVPKAELQPVWQYADVLPHHPYLLRAISKIANAHN